MVLERAARPSGFAEPSTATRQSLVLGFLILFNLRNEDPTPFVCIKKALQVDLESPLTRCEHIVTIVLLERAARPSGFCRAKHADRPKSRAWLSLFAYLEAIVSNQTKFPPCQTFLFFYDLFASH